METHQRHGQIWQSVLDHSDAERQRLEYLGDAVLQLVMSAHLTDRYPEEAEGSLTTMRTWLVRNTQLAAVVKNWSIAPLVEGCGIPKHDYYEMCVGYVMQQHGLRAATEEIMIWHSDLLSQVNPHRDYTDAKSRLNNLALKLWKKPCSYEFAPQHTPQKIAVAICRISRPPIGQTLEVTVKSDGEPKKDMETQVSEAMLQLLSQLKLDKAK